MGKSEQAPAKDDHERLQIIFDGIMAVCQEHGPTAASIESVFVSKNAKSALKLGMARGVAMAACSAAGLPLSEIAPRLAKKAVTGTGTADKKQNAGDGLSSFGGRAKGADAADALGLAIAGIHEAANGQIFGQKASGKSAINNSSINSALCWRKRLISRHSRSTCQRTKEE